MGSLCEFCGDQNSLVYCRSDAASLCLSCDRNVHSANALSRRHSRTLLCNRCYSQPATVRCIEESMSLCHNCDWTGHGTSASASGHKRQTISCYSGCPSSTELSRIWPFFLEFPPMTDPSREQGMCLMNINDNISRTYWGSTQNSSSPEMLNLGRICDLENLNKQSVRIGSSASTSTPMTCDVEQPTTPIGATTPKDIGMSQGDFYEEFAVDDVDLTFENYEELFGASHAHSEQLFDDVGIDSFFETRENSIAHSNGQAEFAAEVSSAGQVKSMQVASGKALSVDSVMSKQGVKADSCLSIPARQARSSLSLSFSGLTGESCAGDYQDCGVSSMLLMGEPPWYPPGPENSMQAANRDNAVMRYKEKKKTRKFEKKIRYASRKARADSRKRVKGRFVKAGEAYDYDPLCQTRSY